MPEANTNSQEQQLPPKRNVAYTSSNGLYKALLGVGATLALNIVIFAFGYGVLWQKVESQKDNNDIIYTMSEQVAVLSIKVDNIEARLDRIIGQDSRMNTLAWTNFTQDNEENDNGGTAEEQEQQYTTQE